MRPSEVEPPPLPARCRSKVGPQSQAQTPSRSMLRQPANAIGEMWSNWRDYQAWNARTGQRALRPRRSCWPDGDRRGEHAQTHAICRVRVTGIRGFAPIAVSMLGQRLRRWPSIEIAIAERVVGTGLCRPVSTQRDPLLPLKSCPSASIGFAHQLLTSFTYCLIIVYPTPHFYDLHI